MKDCIGMLADEATDFFDRKQHPGFIIGHHHGYDSRVSAQGLTQVVEIEFAFVIDWQPGHFTSNLTKMCAKVAYGFMLDCGGNDVTLRRVQFEKSSNGPIVRL